MSESAALAGRTARGARATALRPSDGSAADYVALIHDDRYRRRGVLDTGAGRQVLLDLPEAAELAPDHDLVLEDGRRIAIRALAEPLARVTGPALARLAWHIGNRHTPCQVAGDHLLILRDHVLEAMLEGLGAQISHIEAPFQPEGGAYGHGRTHGHGHAHTAHDDPNAHIPHRHD